MIRRNGLSDLNPNSALLLNLIINHSLFTMNTMLEQLCLLPPAHPYYIHLGLPDLSGIFKYLGVFSMSEGRREQKIDRWISADSADMPTPCQSVMLK